MKELFLLLDKQRAVQEFLHTKKQIITDEIIGSSLLLASNFIKQPGKYNIVVSNLYNAQKIYEVLSTLIGEENCLFYPVDEMLRTEIMASSKEMLAQRLYVLQELLTREHYVLITHAAGIMSYTMSPKLFLENIMNFKVGELYNLDDLKTKLTRAGYARVARIDHSLQFAIRGEILDIYSVNNPHPVRIEFFDEEVESIRFFDLSSQTSIGEAKEIQVLPASETILTKEEMLNVKEKITQRMEKDLKFVDETKHQKFISAKEEIIDDIITHNISSEMIKKYYAFLQDTHHNVLNYSKATQTIIAGYDNFIVTSNILLKEATDYLLSQFEEGKTLSHLSIYQEINKVLDNTSNKIIINDFAKNADDLVFAIREIPTKAYSVNDAKSIIVNFTQTMKKIIISLDSKVQFDLIKNLLQDLNLAFEEYQEFRLPNDKIALCFGSSKEGFELVDESIVLLTSKELFSFKSRASKYTNRYKEAVILQSEKDLEPGDYVVHDTHGIGRFLDITTLEIEGIHRDFLHIQYAGTDILYIPLEQFKLVRKFIGKDGASPRLNKLGTGDWDKTKKRIKERINEMADRLFKLYSERTEITGFAFMDDDELQLQFESEFPFELTKDQKQSLKEIKSDMQKGYPMDRLLCGDVGFGKTEIAFRAAFKAILSGKQVAMLCPTTLLSRQHYERAVERFNNYGIRIAVFSRLIDTARQKDYIEKIKEGKIDLVIGTHRLLSNEIKFNSLGLLIVDEEQRFGVEQKEKIKELKIAVDVLTLTATPIPRTLQMSLVGVRQLSQLNTPPTNRMPIQTYVMPHDNAIIKELIERELSRKGQVFYLHNKVSTINEVAKRLQNTVKSAVISVVHGKMDKDDIEDVMIKFYNNEINVLVCTSIIETGIDITNANMIIIESADRFGLSQLYQIKGRVGRGDRIAYAYLLYKPDKNLNETAKKRLKAIQDFTELGSGYKIAQRDLLIRGAGDILGPEQAGFIDTVGIDMYIQMLNETLTEKKTGVATKKNLVSKNINIDAYIPETYISEKGEKIELYQQIEDIKSLEELDKLKQKMRDIYGRIPNAADSLFRKKELVFNLETSEAFSTFADAADFIEIILSPSFSGIDKIGIILFQALSNELSYIKVSYVDKKIKVKVFKKEAWFTHLETIVRIIIEVYQANNK